MASVTLINCLRARLDTRDPSIDEMNESELRVYAESFLKENTSADDRDIKDAVAEVIGLGPIERLLADDTVSEIMVNSFEHIYVERAGKLERAFEQFSNEAALRRAIDKISMKHPQWLMLAYLMDPALMLYWRLLQLKALVSLYGNLRINP